MALEEGHVIAGRPLKSIHIIGLQSPSTILITPSLYHTSTATMCRGTLTTLLRMPKTQFRSLSLISSYH